MSIVTTTEDVLDYLRTHKNAANILEFIADVQDVENGDDFYKALFDWSLIVFPDKVADAYAATFPPDSEAFEELAKRNSVVKVLVQKEFDQFLPEIMKDQHAVDVLARQPDIQMAVIVQDLPEKKNSQDLIDVLLKRYHEHDTDIRSFVEDLVRDPARALILRK